MPPLTHTLNSHIAEACRQRLTLGIDFKAAAAAMSDKDRKTEKDRNVWTHLRKTVSPCRTVILSITLLSEWESPWLRTGNPAGTRSKILRERRTVHLQKATKYPRTDITSSAFGRAQNQIPQRDGESVFAPWTLSWRLFTPSTSVLIQILSPGSRGEQRQRGARPYPAALDNIHCL